MGTICIAFPYLLVMLNIFLHTCQSFRLPHLWTNCLCPFFFIGFPSCWDLQICNNYLSINLLLILNVYLSQREKYLLISSMVSFTKLKSLNVIESKLFYFFLSTFFRLGALLENFIIIRSQKHFPASSFFSFMLLPFTFWDFDSKCKELLSVRVSSNNKPTQNLPDLLEHLFLVLLWESFRLSQAWCTLLCFLWTPCVFSFWTPGPVCRTCSPPTISIAGKKKKHSNHIYIFFWMWQILSA